MQIAIILILVCSVIILEQKINIKKLRVKIKKQFGKKSIKSKYDWEKIGYHWSEYTKLISSDEKIDDITWNDLEMNNVFCRINNCQSFVGEQMLYSRLHCLPKDNAYREFFEKKILFFISNDKEREKIQLLLCSLGKNDSSYYLPKFMTNLNSYRVPSIWKYRTM